MLLGSGSMACSQSPRILALLEQANVVSPDSITPISVVLIGSGGLRKNPVGVCDLQVKVHDCQISVPTLIVDGQSDEVILRSNMIKHLICMLKTSGDIWENISLSDHSSGEDRALLQL